ncbi:MAG: heparan-alpha-glucosaminide N-acetyltransferase domain-containing protein [Flavisolibacter sp.]
MTITHTAVRPLRITSIDLLRGVVMIIMALDHTRDYFHRAAYFFDPADLQHTTPAIFFTRWVTHFCAPVFIFTAGISAFLMGEKKTKKELSQFLIKRGLWLILLELTILNFGWFFNPSFSLLVLQVIWILGICMLVLAALIFLDKRVTVFFAALLILGHNLLDNTTITGNSLKAFGWAELHQFSFFNFNGIRLVTAYPIIPWIGVMALGYCFGSWYSAGFDPLKRKRLLIWIGSLGVVVFFLLRWSNVYGDPGKWSYQTNPLFTALSFLNTNKYPPSLLYLLMTLSPSLLFLAFAERFNNPLTRVISTYGRVPLFYYLIHVYLLHLMAMFAAVLTGFHWYDSVFTSTWITAKPSLRGYGFSLPVVYLIWFTVVAGLYPLCKKYDAYKQHNRSKWWLRYV